MQKKMHKIFKEILHKYLTHENIIKLKIFRNNYSLLTSRKRLKCCVRDVNRDAFMAFTYALINFDNI